MFVKFEESQLKIATGRAQILVKNLTFVTSAMSISLMQLMLNRQNETNSLNPKVFVSFAVPDRYTFYLVLSSCVDLHNPNCVRIRYDTGQR